MIKLIALLIWGFLTIHTLVTGESSVFEQAIAQGTLSAVLLISAIKDSFN